MPSPPRQNSAKPAFAFAGANAAIASLPTALLRPGIHEIIIAGGARTGKTTACCYAVLMLAMRYPGTRVLISRKTRTSMTQSTLDSFQRIAYTFGQDAITRGKARNQRDSYRLSNASEIVIGGLDQTSRIMGSEYDVIYVSEATEIDLGEWQDLGSRLSGKATPYQLLLGDCNPGSPSHWIYQRALAGNLKLLTSRHADNPYITSDYLAWLHTLTGHRKARLLRGEWVAAEGAIYPTFAPSTHVIAPTPIPDDALRIVSIDWGYANPCAIQWWARMEDGWHLYREWYHTLTSVEQVGDLLSQYAEEGYTRIYADHDALARKALGWKTQRANKDVTAGISYIASLMEQNQIKLHRAALLKTDPALLEQGKPTCLAEEIPGYVFAGANHTGSAKDAPLKLNDHACFVAETMITTRDGNLPIVDCDGAEVLTRLGWKKAKLIRSGMQEVREYAFEAYSMAIKLIATPSHPVWTEYGWLAISQVATGDKVRIHYAYPSEDTTRVSALMHASSKAHPARQVYNLTVEDCPEFYANRLLVHNCDALRYALYSSFAK